MHLQVLELGAQRLAQLGVERRQRLVHQEDARLAHDGAADRDALHLAAGQPVGLAIEQMLDAQRLGGARDAILDLGVGQPADLRLQREFEVLAHRVARIERILLQHQRHVALGRAPVGDVDAVDEDLALGRLFEPGDQAQRRGLAGAGLAEQDEELAVGDVEVEVGQRGVACRILVMFLSWIWAMVTALTPSDLPLAVSKKCAWAGSIRAKTFRRAGRRSRSSCAPAASAEPTLRSTMS